MRHTDDEIEQAAERFERVVNGLSVAEVEAAKLGDLRTVAEAADTVRFDQIRLREAVEIARAHGHSWNRIGIALGISRQAARQRFAEMVDS